jgi:signal transduction histidine kinase
VLQRQGDPVAALVHDPALLDEANLVGSVSTVMLLTLENERLRAQVQAQLQEVKASRTRIVEAADAERRRVERNLHDGAQQRLLSSMLALGLARDRLVHGPEAPAPAPAQAQAQAEVAQFLGRATEELERAVDELRELAQGIHPAILTDQGLGPALDSLCARSPLPVVASVACERYSAVLEGMAYFGVSEALANVAKHSGATSARVSIAVRGAMLDIEVVDDGVGGADPSRGSGLRSLGDRVAALGGTLEIESPPGGGTSLRVRLPCD